MTSPATEQCAPSRSLVHRRSVTYSTFRRDDGLWDLEARIEDCRQDPVTSFEGAFLPAGAPYHQLQVTLTMDGRLLVCNATARMAVAPFPECQGATQSLDRLVGATLGPGWRKAVDAALGGTSGCTHLREMLYNAATPAMQAVPSWTAGQRTEAQAAAPTDPVQRPHFIGGCYSWRLDGPVVLRHFPQFFRRDG